MRTIAILILMIGSAEAAGERELIAVLSARVRASFVAQMPDEPPTIHNRLLNGTAIDAGTVSALEATNQAQRDELKELHEELEATHGAGVVPKQDATTEGNAARQPDADWTRPPVLTLNAPVSSAPNVGRYQLTVHSSPTCGPCESAQRRDGAGDEEIALNWTYDPIPSGIPVRWPTYTWRDKTNTLRYVQGVHSLGKLLSIIERNDPPQRGQVVAASAVGGQMKTHGQIRAAMSQWRDRLGDGTELRLRVDKTGDQKLSVTRLIHGEKWTARQVCGRFGRVEISTTAKLPLQSAGFTYRHGDDGRFTIDPEPLTFGLPNPSEGYGATGEAVGMDPVTLGLTIVQIANALAQILNPQVDVILPGTISFVARVDGEKLTVKFADAPSIHVAMWLQFDLQVQEVVVTPTNVHVAFNADLQRRNWIKITSRDFVVNDQ